MSNSSSWEPLLHAPRACDHLIQLYTDDAFLMRAAVEYLGAGLRAGEAAFVIATPAHAGGFKRHLTDIGVDVAAALRRDQFIVADTDTCLAQFMVDGMPDRETFRTLISSVFDRIARAGYATARLYGEMVDLLWDHNLPATVRLEELWNEVLRERRVSLLCAYRMDTFDPKLYRAGVLHHLTRCHSHFIPVDDYARFNEAVELAYREYFGITGEATLFRELLRPRHPEAPVMPKAQAALQALRSVSPDVADGILRHAREHYRARDTPLGPRSTGR